VSHGEDLGATGLEWAHIDGAETHEFPAGGVLIEEGDSDRRVYLVVEGTAEVLDPSTGSVLVELGPGDVAGEVAVVAGGVRTATVRAASHLKALGYDPELFEVLLDAAPEFAARLEAEAARRLERVHLRETLARLVGSSRVDLLDEIEAAADWVRLLSGDVLFTEGDLSDSGYLVISGRIRLLSGASSDTPVIVGEVGRDRFVGETGLVVGEPRAVTAVAVRDSILVRIPLVPFLALLERHPAALVPVVLQLARRSSTFSSRDRRERSIALVVTCGEVERTVASRLVEAIGRHGTVAHVSGSRVDEWLGREGVSQAEPRSSGAIRVGRLLHELELEHTYLVCETDREPTAWSAQAVRGADLIVIVVSPAPDLAETAMIDAHLSKASAHAEIYVAVHHPSGTERPRSTATILERWPDVEVVHVREGSGADLGRLARLVAGTATGLVLGGGGARGFAHLGVQRALEELGVTVDVVGGTSIGASLGGLLAQGLGAEDRLAITTRLFAGLLDYTIPVVSLVKGRRITASIAAQYGGWDIEDFWLPFYCMSTNLTRAVEVEHRRGDATTAIRASVSIPGVMPPVAVGEDLLVDGGVLNNLPADVMRRRLPTGRVIAVDVAPPRGPRARGEMELSVSGWEALRSKVRGKGYAYPAITAILMRTMITASVRERDRTVAGDDIDLYLDLDLRGTGLLEFETAPQVAKAGYEAAMPRIEAWLAGGPG
jgi:predicted acylesterase/phospholipase RssA/CRP-like cAMP-binding protein